TSTGTVTAVDQAAVTAFAADRIRAAVPPGRRVIAGSTRAVVGAPTVDGSAVVFPVTASAEQVQVLDARTVMAQVKGKSAADARRILGQYGDATVTLWPDWVTTVPGIDARIDVRVGAVASASPGQSVPSVLPSARPASGSPSGSGSASGSASASSSQSAVP
ncbi:MAG TPA: hypothetical protein VGC90_11285, partial [Candidatus Limnocylindrales bacterium]